MLNTREHQPATLPIPTPRLICRRFPLRLADQKTRAAAARDEAERLRAIADAGRIEENRLRNLAAFAQIDLKRERAKLAVLEYGRTMQVAHQEWRDTNFASMRALLDGTTPSLRNWEWRYLDHLHDPALLTLKGHSVNVWSAAFSPDGTRIVTTSLDRTAKVWDALTGKELLTLQGHTDRVRRAAFSPDGTRIVTASGDNTARVWDARPLRDRLPPRSPPLVAPPPRIVK